MPAIADRVQETTATTGTGAITLGGASTNYRSFATGFGSSSQTVYYTITEGANWEVGIGTFNGTTGLTRDTILSSSNAGSAITLAGAAIVWSDAPAQLLSDARRGRIGGAQSTGAGFLGR